MTPFVGPSYSLIDSKADLQRSTNMYLVKMEAAGKAKFILESAPGLIKRINFGIDAPVRGSIEVGDRCFAAVGEKLFEVFSNWAFVERGTLNTATGPVSMDYGLFQLVMVDGPYGYVLKLTTNEFVRITSEGFYGANRVRFFDGYFVFNHPFTQQFYISALNDATSEDATDFASAEGAPDPLNSFEVDHSELILFRTKGAEVWFDAGSADFPFQRNRGQSFEVGCIATHSVVKSDNGVFWIGRDKNGSGIVYGLHGSGPQRVSNLGIEQQLQSSTDLTQAVGQSYQANGLTFVLFNAPGLKATLVYEVSTGTWHSRCDLDANGEFTASRIVSHVFAFGKHLGGGSDGKLYELSKTAYTNAGDPLVRERRSPHDITRPRSRQFFKEFWLDCTTGGAGQGIDPQVELSYTDDSGANWSTPDLRSAGKVGQRFPRLRWPRLSYSFDRAWRIRFSANAPFSIIDGGAVE